MKNRFLFVLSPPYCGSTVLWRMLGSSPNVSMMEVEGQYMPQTEAWLRKKPWNADYQPPWADVRAAWEAEWDLSKPILMEKSPPHIVRAGAIEANFQPASFVLLMRDPYAFCEGFLRRRGGAAAAAAEFWVTCARYQQHNLATLAHTHFLSYERMTDDVKDSADSLVNFLPELQRLDWDGSFAAQSIISYEPRKMTNMNELKIAQVSAEAMTEINSVLSQHPDLMQQFGYTLRQSDKHHPLRHKMAVLRLKKQKLTARFWRIIKK